MVARPDIVLLVLDTQRLDRLSCYGYRHETTPQLDSLATGATLFRQAVSSAQWTIPSHSSMFTGLYPYDHNMYHASSVLPGRLVTLAERLSASGYFATAYCNNPLLGVVNNGLRRGFHSFLNYGGLMTSRPNQLGGHPRLFDRYRRGFKRLLANVLSAMQDAFARSDTLLDFSLSPMMVPLWQTALSFKGNSRKALDDAAQQLIERQNTAQDRPIFSFINLMGRHMPYHPPRRLIARFAPGVLQEKSARHYLRRFNSDVFGWLAPLADSLVTIGPFSIHWYGIIMATAIFVGTLVASRYVARKKHDPGTVWEMLFWILIPALIGARLYFVFIQSSRGPNGLPYYLGHPLEILAIWHGGIHIYGALIFGGIAILLFIRLHKLPLLIYLDAVGLGLLIGQSIGRLGNFINQELYGPPTTLPWGLRIDPQFRVAPYNNLALYPTSVRFQPLFLYELLWNLLGFILLLYISRRFSKRLLDGDLALLYLVWYPLGRFMLEFLRTDSWFFPGTPFDLVHLLSAISILTAAALLFLRHRGKPAVQEQKDSTGAAGLLPETDPERETSLKSHEQVPNTSGTNSLGVES